jgi:hypothetical protein
MPNIFHYTDKEGWNSIRSQPVWTFKASQPRDPDRPTGAYFTDIEPTATNLRTLYKRIRVPRIKQEYVFWFVGTAGLRQLNNGLGREKRIYFSPIDYVVPEERQKHGDASDLLFGVFL